MNSKAVAIAVFTFALLLSDAQANFYNWAVYPAADTNCESTPYRVEVIPDGLLDGLGCTNPSQQDNGSGYWTCDPIVQTQTYYQCSDGTCSTNCEPYSMGSPLSLCQKNQDGLYVMGTCTSSIPAVPGDVSISAYMDWECTRGGSLVAIAFGCQNWGPEGSITYTLDGDQLNATRYTDDSCTTLAPSTAGSPNPFSYVTDGSCQPLTTDPVFHSYKVCLGGTDGCIAAGTDSDAEAQTTFNVAFSVSSVVAGLVIIAIIRITSRAPREDDDRAAPSAANIALWPAQAASSGAAGVNNPLYALEGPADRPGPSRSAAKQSPCLRRVYICAHVANAIAALFMLCVALGGLTGSQVWTIIAADFPPTQGTGYLLLDIHSTQYCSHTSNTTTTCPEEVPLFASIGAVSTVNGLGTTDYFTATFAAGVVVTVLLSTSLVFSLLAATINVMMIMSKFAHAVRGRLRRAGPYLLAVPWGLLLLSLVVWIACQPWQLLRDLNSSNGPQFQMTAVWGMLLMPTMLIVCVVLGFLCLLMAMLIRRPTIVSRLNGQTRSVPAMPQPIPLAAASPQPEWLPATTPDGQQYWYDRVTGVTWGLPTGASPAGAEQQQPQPFADRSSVPVATWPSADAAAVPGSVRASVVVRRYGQEVGGKKVAMPVSIDELLAVASKIFNQHFVCARTAGDFAEVDDISLVSSGSTLIVMTASDEEKLPLTV